MPSVRFSGVAPSTLYMGALNVNALYYGSTQVWPPLDVEVDVPLDSFAWQDYAPSLFATVAVPSSPLTWVDYPPEIAGGEALSVPADEWTWADFAPAISTGAKVDVPTDVMAWADFAPSLFATVAVPADAWTWTDYAPAVGPLVNVVVPSDAFAWTDYAPSVFATIAVPNDSLTWTDYAPSVGADVFVPTDAWTWTDYIPTGNYGFSGGFSDGFSSAPSDPPDTEIEVPTDGGLVWADFAPSAFAGASVAVPAQALTWVDYAPSVEVDEGYSFTMTAGVFSGVVLGYSDGSVIPAFGAIDGEPVSGHALAFLSSSASGAGGMSFAGDATALLSGKSLWVEGVEYPFDDADWAYDGSSLTSASWATGAPPLADTSIYDCEIK